MRLISLKDLLSCRVIPRSDNKSVKCCLLEDVKVNRGAIVIVFVSHRWSGGDFPDTPKNEKYEVLVSMLKEVMVSCGVDGSQLFLWVDYFCIDQDNAAEKLKGIDSLPAYIQECDVIVSPFVNAASVRMGKLEGDCALRDMYKPDHQLYQWLSAQCFFDHENEYFGRAWCRLEMYLASNLNMPEDGFKYFQRISNHREDRPHFIREASWHYSIVLPHINNSWYDRYAPGKGKTKEHSDLSKIEHIVSVVPRKQCFIGYEGGRDVDGKKAGEGQILYEWR